MLRVLVVDDAPSVRAMVRTALERGGFAVAEAASAEAARVVLREDVVDVLVLDVQLPGDSGLALLEELRASSGIPVLLVTAWGGESDKIAGLDLGADDYIVKPFSALELAARVRATVRGRQGGRVVETIESGCVRIDLRGHRVSVDGIDVGFTAREFALLAHLATAAGRTCSRDELLRDVWSSKAEWQDPNTLTEHVSRVRQKLTAAAPAAGAMVETVRGQGYRFAT